MGVKTPRDVKKKLTTWSFAASVRCAPMHWWGWVGWGWGGGRGAWEGNTDVPDNNPVSMATTELSGSDHDRDAEESLWGAGDWSIRTASAGRQSDLFLFLLF